MLASKYFGMGMEEDSRRCYLRALRSDPRTLLRDGALRHFLGTLVGLKRYEACKAAIKGLLGGLLGS